MINEDKSSAEESAKVEEEEEEEEEKEEDIGNIREKIVGQVLETSNSKETAQPDTCNQPTAKISPRSSPASSPKIGSLIMTTDTESITTTLTTSASPSATSSTPIRSKAVFTAMQTNIHDNSGWNQNSAQEEPELLPEEPVEASLSGSDERQEKRREGSSANCKGYISKVQDEGASGSIKTAPQDCASGLWLDCRVAADTLTSLSAHVDEVKREVDQIQRLKPNGEQVTTTAATAAATTAPGSRIHSKEAQDPLRLIHHLMQKRQELRQVDTQLFNIITQYMMQLDRSTLDTNLPEASWSDASHLTHLYHQQQQQNWISHYEYLATYDFYRQMAMQNYSADQTNNVSAVDLSSPVGAKRASLSSSSSSITYGLRSSSSTSLDTLSTGIFTGDIPSANLTGTGNPFADSFRAVRKTSSVNLKKTRLLADLNHSQQDMSQQVAREQADGQTSPLNLLKRHCSPARLGDPMKTTSFSTSSAVSTASLSSGSDANVTMQQQQVRRHRASITSDGLDGYTFTVPDATVPNGSHQVGGAFSNSPDFLLLNPQHKKFRPLTQAHQEHQFEASKSADLHQGAGTLDAAHFNAAALQLAHHQHRQQQLFLSEMLIDQQQRHLMCKRAQSPQQASSMTTTASSMANYRQHQHQALMGDPRSAGNQPANYVNSQEGIKCALRQANPLSSDCSTAYILATMQSTGDSGCNKQDASSKGCSNLPGNQPVHSTQFGAANNEANLHTVTITPAKFASKNTLELVRATIGKDHQLVPLRQPHSDSLAPKMAFRCHVCGSGFEDRHRLQQHLSIHLNLHPSWFEEKTIKETMAQYESKRGDYLCSICNLRHETTTEFDKHMQLHGDKPHRCDLCDQDNKLVCFRYYRQLLTHLRSHCFLYSCRFAPDCKQTSNRKDYLKLHILKHHLNNKLPEQYTICCH